MRIMCWADSALPQASNYLFKGADLQEAWPKSAKKAKNTKKLPFFDKYCQQRTQKLVKSYSPASEAEDDPSDEKSVSGWFNAPSSLEYSFPRC